MAKPSRIRVHHYEGETALTLPGNRVWLHLRRLEETPLTYEVILHRLKPNGWIGRRELPIIFTGTPLEKLLRNLADRAGMDRYCWRRCLRIPRRRRDK